MKLNNLLRMLQSSIIIASDTESPSADGGTEEFTSVDKMKKPKLENISELVDESRDARVPPLILLDISPEKVEQSPKKRKVLHLSEGSSSSPNNNNVIDSSVLESTVDTSSDVTNSLHLSTPESKCDECPSAFSTNQERLLHDLALKNISVEKSNKSGERVIDCNKFGCEKKNDGGQVTYRKFGRGSGFTQEQISVLRSNYSVNKNPSREDMMKIAEAVGHPYNKVAKWFNHTRGKDKSQGTGKLSSLRKCPDCDEIISKFNGRHKLTCAGRKDLRKEEHEVKNDDVVVKMRQEKVSKGQGDMSNLDNQPGEDVASQSELNDSYSSLRALLDPDPDSDLMNLTWT